MIKSPRSKKDEVTSPRMECPKKLKTYSDDLDDFREII